jgi:hypothetical protein
LNGAAGGTGFTSSWSAGSPVNITDISNAIEFGGGPGTITASIVSGVNANNVLSATTTGTFISQTYNAGTGVLTLTPTGLVTQAQYQQVLRSIKYNNTASAPGVNPVVVNFVGHNSFGDGATAEATIQTGILANSSVIGRRLFYNQSGTGVNNWGHAGGLIGGFLAAFVFAPTHERPEQGTDRVLAGAVLALTAAAFGLQLWVTFVG